MGTEILSWWEKFKLNLKHLWAYATVWVLTLWGGAYAYWVTLSDAEHTAFYDAVPFGLGKFGPLFVFAATYIAAHGWPQPVLEEKNEASKVAAVEKKLDQIDNGPM